MSATTDNKLELAYAALLERYEPSIAVAQVPVLCSTLIEAQAPNPARQGNDSEAAEDEPQLPVPRVLITAKGGEENPPNSGVIETELIIEAADNSIDGSVSGALDDLIRAAARPLFYDTINDPTGTPPIVGNLFSALSALVSNFLVYGMPMRANGTEMEPAGSVVKRSITATFLCCSTA